ncbi:spermatogenesis-associated protein 6-like [Diadema setosum]|uniref:spermatogenesis-associated protein 6-like n=1 Tax=Diadema setosum TaxID=31175 RepID=UPI003B3ADB6D
MPRNSLRIIVDLSIEAVTCPGVILKDREDVYLSICMLGYQKRTLCLPPFFPLLFHQKFRFERTFMNCGDPAHLVHLLQYEDVLIELIQLNEDYSQDGTVLALYQVSARDFLYPEDSLLPSYAESDREILMQKKIWFSGISPKLEFSCKTSIVDTSTPGLDFYRDRVAERQDLAEDFVIVTPLRKSLRKKKKRNKSYEAPTISSTMKASRLSSGDLEDRPPFIVKRKDSHNRATSPSRASSPSPRRPASAPPTRPRTPISFRTSPPGITGNTSEYISEADCRICRIYQRYFGRRYWGHKKYYHPHNGIKFQTSEPVRDDVRDEELERILNERAAANDFSDSTDDLIDTMNGLSVVGHAIPGTEVEYARLPHSPRLSRSRSRTRSRSVSPSRRYSSPRSRSLSPVLAKSPLRERVGSRPGSPTHADVIHHRVRRALHKNYLSDDSDDSVTSEEALGALRSSLNGGSLRNPDSSVTSHLDDGHYLSNRSAELTGKSHRELFEDSMSRIYRRLHRNLKAKPHL